MDSYIILCDESDKDGEIFSDFFGGIIATEAEFSAVEAILGEKKQQLRPNCGELSWKKIAKKGLHGPNIYKAFADAFLDLVEASRIKMRVMFTHNSERAGYITQRHHDYSYFIMYEHFIKHAFGLRAAPKSGAGISLRLMLDMLPDSEKGKEFKREIGWKTFDNMYGRKIVLHPDNVREVDSSKYALSQGLDVVLGVIQFYLNEKNKELKEAPTNRGLAKAEVAAHVIKRLEEILPRTDLKQSTSFNPQQGWNASYGHWRFKANPRFRGLLKQSRPPLPLQKWRQHS